jgi:plastocyanin
VSPTRAHHLRETRRRGPVLACAVALALLPACSGGGGTGGTAPAEGAAGTSTTAGPSAAASGAVGAGTSASGAPGGEAPPTTPPTAAAVTVTAADFTFRMDATDLPAGTSTITLANQGHATHDLVVEQDGREIGRSDRIGPGQSTTFTVTLQPGRYVLYCSVANHRAMGMQTEVTVG